jgi:energy-converting hydrogenase Eha subunit E
VRVVSAYSIEVKGLHRLLLVGQGWLYLLTGAWPVIHLGSFEAVTGEKYDDFLVRTVGLLLAVIGAALLLALRRRAVTRELLIVTGGTAASLLAIDVIYWALGRLPPIYLVDAVIEAAFVAATATLLWRSRGR